MFFLQLRSVGLQTSTQESPKGTEAAFQTKPATKLDWMILLDEIIGLSVV